MFDNDHIPTKTECEQYFLSRGVRAERGDAFWEHESHFGWRSQFSLTERADRWIANSRPYERLRPDEIDAFVRLPDTSTSDTSTSGTSTSDTTPSASGNCRKGTVPLRSLKPFPIPKPEPPDPDLIGMPEHMRRHRS